MPSPFVPVPDCCRTSLVYVYDSQVIVNTFHFRKPGFTILDLGNLNTAMHTWWTANWKPLIAPACSLTQIVSVDLQSQTAPSATLVISPIEPGTNPGANPLPGNVTWCASLRTLFRGRNFRGRLYMPAMMASQMTLPNILVAGFVGSAQAALAQLMTPTNVASFAYVVVSRFLNHLPRLAGINTLITAIAGDQTTDSQRRRLPGRGA